MERQCGQKWLKEEKMKKDRRIAEIKESRFAREIGQVITAQDVPSYKREETLKYIFEECEATKIQGKKWEELVNGERRNLEKLMETTWKRRRTEIERQENSTE